MAKRRFVLACCWMPLALLIAMCGCGGDAARPDLVIIVIDTWRADHTGASGKRLLDGRSPTPVLDSIAMEAAGPKVSLAPVPLTLPSHTTLFSGLGPRRHGVRENDSFSVVADPKARGFTFLAEELRAAGYRTAAFVSADPLARRFGLDAGFEVYDEAPRERGPRPEIFFSERHGQQTTDAALRWLDGVKSSERSDPYFLFVHYFDPHAPYRPWAPGEPAFAEFSGRPAVPAGRAGDYLLEVMRVDFEIGRLLAHPAIRGRRHVLLITGDHGEALGEHGEETHGHLVHDATIRVPFLMRPASGDARPVRAEYPARHEDVYPTLLSALGLNSEMAVARDGENLFAPATMPWRHYAESTYSWYQFGYAQLQAWRDPQHKLVVGGGRTELFAWPSDPQEIRDLRAEQLDRVAALELELERELRRPGFNSAAELRAAAIEPTLYMGARPPGLVEPDPGVNRTLPRIEDRWPLVRDLEAALAIIGQDKRRATEAVLLLERHQAERAMNPALLFWTARARHWAGRQEDLAASTRTVHYREAERLYREHVERYRDPRSIDAGLRLKLDRWLLTQDAAEARAVIQAATGEIAAGARRPLPFIFRSQAREILGDLQGALEDLLEARAFDREDPRLAADIERLGRALGRN